MVFFSKVLSRRAELRDPSTSNFKVSKRHRNTYASHASRIAPASIALLAGLCANSAYAQTPHGLTGEYFTNASLSGNPALTRVDPIVQFSWNLGSPDPIIPADNFSVRWSGQIEVPTTGSYSFATYSDDGIRVTVNGQQVINEWSDHVPSWTYGDATPITLQAGQRYNITIEYYERTGTAFAQIYWSPNRDKGNKRYIPISSGSLYPKPIATVTTGTFAPPTNLRVAGTWVNNGGPTDMLRWDAVTNAVGYNVYQYDMRIATNVTQPSFLVPYGLWWSGFTYTVTAVNAAGDETLQSNIVTSQGAPNPSVQPAWMPPLPSPPTGVHAEVHWNGGTPRIAVGWKGVNAAYTYSIYRDNVRIADGIWGLHYVDKDVRAGEKHTYNVTAVNLPWTQLVESGLSDGPVAAQIPATAPTGAIGVVTTSDVVANDDSITISWFPVPGAADYRVYNTAKPLSYKYSGGGLSVEMNGIDPAVGANLVVEAVDKMGPFQRTDGFMSPGAMDHAGQAVASAINGQGDPSNIPTVIARSVPVPVACESAATRLSGAQVFFDTFRNSTAFVQSPTMDPAIVAANAGDPNNAQNRYVREWQNDKWVIRNYWGDMDTSKNFIMSNHFMDTLYDGGTPWGNIGAHNNNASLVMTPKATADISGGKVLHVTFEVDAHFDSRRWCDVIIAEPGDPLLVPGKFFENNALPTVSGNIFRWEITSGTHNAQIFYGQDASANRNYVKLFNVDNGVGPDNFGPAARTRWDGVPLLNGTTQDLDKRHRFDLYLSNNRFQVYEEGGLIKDLVFPNGATLPFKHAQIYFVHQLYHTGNDHGELIMYAPQEKYWINHRPWADERHWDNMGFEVLNWFPLSTTIRISPEIQK